MADSGDTVQETFAFACGSCGETWQRTYEVMFFTDPAGLTRQEYVDEAGAAVRSPLVEAICPKCGGRQVHAVTPELLERARSAEHAEHPHLFRFTHRNSRNDDAS
ncbi:hypothetical protein G3I40_06510 [Streptomyces sp. SID14478]|uniref:hypothetical protein n=1 Tax=Streptomyces sp. SID14478 TaxID=2706073 RepID=UPI0013DD5351|nr:hypothetical protein [Streptomyces sp. SID14478]NEB74886.1 hypothetical protein [Streptomyces sp. SID14478]